ncbi:DegV domain-containing protein [Sphaerisporangium siamense]|uniref:DegV family protein with EDD domain n=1 Tax=Sphaerisporangium siamense TaxID=795645 RepID=A0A7W7DEI3_9ACTN|nr:DegV family protein [Sphaerisporangium siamense]MBB4705342.1 DegV family protein with EDD domain [Sphaerisporangium siamense]GII86505.1 DegV domain-containing protein [Sphaerisporangium siamense]
MSQPVVVVTDSTSSLDRAEAARLGVTVIPLQVVIEGRTLDDSIQIDAEGVAAALRARSPVTTSRPAPQRFKDAYEAAAARGAASVVSIHISGDMSGTVDAARIAAKDAPIPVDVVDSGSLAMGLGFPVLAAAEAARRGASHDEVAAVARARADATKTYFYVDTLEYLRRGGRIGSAASLLGSALAIKPLLHITQGTIAPLEKVRTAGRAIARLEELAVRAAGDTPADVAVHHLAAAARAAMVAEHLTERIPALAGIRVLEVAPVVGVHVGPGMLGVAITPTLTHLPPSHPTSPSPNPQPR